VSLPFPHVLADYIYISGSVIGAILVILLVVWLLRRT
jgi:hypothetical protein